MWLAMGSMEFVMCAMEFMVSWMDLDDFDSDLTATDERSGGDVYGVRMVLGTRKQ